MSLPSSFPPHSVDIAQESNHGTCALSYEPLDVDRIVRSVQDPGAGAIAIFIGTTRNSFKGRTVTRLDYQAYSKLAIKTMVNIVNDAVAAISPPNHREVESHPSSFTMRCTLHHRLGTVLVGQPSIVVAVSSPHRKEAFATCEAILEEVKTKVQIWKREFYEGGDGSDAEWKANY